MRHLIALATVVCLLNSSGLLAAESRGMVYDFGAKWCGPCQQVAPIVEKLQREGLPIRKIDIDEQKEMANKFQVRQIPTFVLVIDGKEVDRTTGRMTEADLRRLIARIPQPTPPEVATPAPQQLQGPMSIPVQLGESVPLTRPEPIRTEPAQTRVAENDEKRGLRDLLPFGKKTTERPEEVVRGNDSTLTGSNSAAAMPASSGDVAASTSTDPMEASVRIRVITNGRIDLGSGTVISSKPGFTQILTCAHIFKEFSDDSRIEVDVFERGGVTPYTAGLTKFDATSDLGLISIPTPNAIPSIQVGGKASAPRVGTTVAAIGCSGGDEPTRQQSRVTDIDKYEGPHNLLCVGVPVRGRSGGGLFNEQGEIVGVCSAADEREQRGFYSGLLAIHQMLDQCNLTALYAPPAAAQPKPEEKVAVAEAPSSRSEFPARSVAADSAQGMFPTSAETGPAASRTESGPVDVQAGDAEVVVIIRDRNNPASANRVVILHEASPKFMSYLSGELPEGELNMNLLGAGTLPSSLPATSRPLQAAAPARSFPADQSQLRPTALSQPVVPQKYIRTAASR